MRNVKKLKELSKNILLALFTFLVLLLCLEMFFRIFMPQQVIIFDENLYIPDNTLGWKHNVNVTTKIDSGERTVLVKTDEFGHRIGNGSDSNASFNVLALGDSFLESVQVGYEDTMCAILERRLSDKLGVSTSITNTGVGEYNPNHYLMTAMNEFSRKNYSYTVLFFFIENDFQEKKITQYPPRESVYSKFAIPSSLSFEEIKAHLIVPINEFFERNSHFYKFTKDRSKVLLARIGLTGYDFPDVFYKNQSNSSRWDVTASILDDVRNVSASHNSGFLVVIIPTKYQVDENDFYDELKMFDINESEVDLEQPNNELKKRLDAYNISYVDLLNGFKDADKVAPLYGKVDHHLSPEGHVAAADILEPLILAGIEDKLGVNQNKISGYNKTDSQILAVY
jgi:hypothetical protein